MLGDTADAAKSTFPDSNARTGDIAVAKQEIGGSARVHIGNTTIINNNHPTPTIPTVSPAGDAARPSSAQYYIPFRRNKQFVGRAKTIDELHRKLFQENCGRVALVGLGGVGKTEVALEFAHRVKDTERDCSVFWVPALSRESFEQAYTRTGELLGIGRDAGKQKDILKTVHDYLSQQTAGRCLLIVDNADDDRILRDIEPFLPESDESRILFTTRTRSVAVAAAQTHIVRLDQMDEKEANYFFQTALFHKELATDDLVVTAELLKDLTYLPLAINQAAAYLNTNEPTTCRQYLNMLQGSEKYAIALLSDSTGIAAYHRSDNAVATTWLVSFNRIRELDSTAEAILLFMACIESKEIPESILPGERTSPAFRSAIGILVGYAFLSLSHQQVNGTSDVVYIMHRLVHLSAKLWLSKELRTMDVVKNACQHMSNIFPTPEWKNRDIWRKYLPHTVNLLGIGEGKELVERYDLCHKLAKCMMVDGKFEDAVPYLEECAGRKQKLDTSQHDHLYRSMSELWFNHIGRQLRNFTQTFWSTPNQSTERQWTASDLDLRQELALAYLYSDQFDKAEDLLLFVITEKKRTMKDGNLSLLQSQHELARAYHLQGKREVAWNLLAQVLDNSKNTLASCHVVLQAIHKDYWNWWDYSGISTHTVVWTDVLKTNVDVVDLSDGSIGDAGASVVANALRYNKMWRVLNLRSNSITEQGAEVLTEGLKLNSTLVELVLSKNFIGNVGASALAEALNINTTLTSLDLRDNSINETGASALAEALTSNKTLMVIDLSCASALAEALKINGTLASLDLLGNAINDAGASALAEALKINGTMKFLNLHANDIGIAGAIALAEALKINGALTSLDLRANHIGIAGASALASALKINGTLTSLNMGGYGAGDAIRYIGASAPSRALKINGTLTYFDLLGNAISDAGASALAEALKVNGTLTFLDLCVEGADVERYPISMVTLSVAQRVHHAGGTFGAANDGSNLPVVNVTRDVRDTSGAHAVHGEFDGNIEIIANLDARYHPFDLHGHKFRILGTSMDVTSDDVSVKPPDHKGMANRMRWDTTKDFGAYSLGPHVQVLGFEAKSIIGLVFSTLSAVLGIAAVAWYPLCGGLDDEELELEVAATTAIKAKKGSKWQRAKNIFSKRTEQEKK
ncbi:hypothetical protein HDU93_004230 [Gonapodya sp. JEL0774]|nr:hypothetical protein HDU93_004230 [Gonapodya sp. JEL0774]